MISVVFFVLICANETKTEMNILKSCTRQSALYSYLLYPQLQFNILLFYSMASFFPNGYSGFQETWMTECGQKLKPPKFPGPKLTPKKFHTELRTTKIIQLKSSQLIKYVPNVSYSKRIPEFKILNPKNPSDHRRHLKSGVPPLEFRSTPNFLIESFAYDVFHKSKTI